MTSSHRVVYGSIVEDEIVADCGDVNKCPIGERETRILEAGEFQNVQRTILVTD